MSNKDLSGQKFGKLLAVKPAADTYKPFGERVPQWLCVCECGNAKVVRQTNLLTGHTTSCGCSRGKKPGPGLKQCPYHPTAVDCAELNCEKCGWNPLNKKLRSERIKKVMIKAGRDYDEPDEAESSEENS